MLLFLFAVFLLGYLPPGPVRSTWPRPPSNMTLPPTPQTPQTRPLTRHPGVANLPSSAGARSSDNSASQTENSERTPSPPPSHIYNNDTRTYVNNDLPLRQPAPNRPSFIFNGRNSTPSSGRDTIDIDRGRDNNNITLPRRNYPTEATGVDITPVGGTLGRKSGRGVMVFDPENPDFNRGNSKFSTSSYLTPRSHFSSPSPGSNDQQSSSTGDTVVRR